MVTEGKGDSEVGEVLGGHGVPRSSSPRLILSANLQRPDQRIESEHLQ